ncbi:hypothetical protein Mpsy_1070 [Methanolobus psychrophilus R15]|nr:hypothetical protein Mpsy_1070 [Methanolobus psychrophilus R15]
MGIDRLILDQKERSKQSMKHQNMNPTETRINEVPSNQPFDKQTENTSPSLKNRKNDNIVITRSPEHQEKIDKVKSMLNLK